MKNFIIVLGLAATVFFTACGDDDEAGLGGNSSVSLTIDGVTYTKPSDGIVSFVEFSINDVTSYSISGEAANGTDTIDFSINIPELAVATYSKETTDDNVVSITVITDTATYRTNPFFTNVEDVSTYTLNITAASEQSVSGNFTGTLLDDFDNVTVEATGEFVAEEFFIDIFGQ